jgi:hypothetical protein
MKAHPDNNKTEHRLTVIECALSDIHRVSAAVDSLDSTLERRFDYMDKEFKYVNGRLDKVNDRLFSILLWLLALAASAISILFMLIIHGFHWL